MRTRHLVLGLTILLTLAAAPMPAGAADGCGGDGDGEKNGPEGSLHQRLADLDRQLRQSLTAIVHDPEHLPAQLENDVESFRGALRDLERQAHALAATSLVRKARRLGDLLHNLEWAADGADPAGALPRAGRRAGEILHPPRSGRRVPANDDCAAALDLEPGQTVFGDTSEATQDGEASCGSSLFSNDVWFKVTTAQSGYFYADTFGSGYDTVLSVHSGCPGTIDNQIDCDDDTFGLASAVSFYASAVEQRWIRLSGFDQETGPYELHLGRGGTISGAVTAAENGAPLAGGDVRLWSSDGYHVGSTSTGATGQYALGGLEPDGYFLSTRDFGDFLDQLYDDLPCPVGSCEVTAGTAVEVASNSAVADIDFALDEGGAIAGTVTDAATGAPIAGVEVEIRGEEGTYFFDYTYTDDDGGYQIGGLAAGTYFATARNSAYRSEIYDDLPCAGNCEPWTGTPIAVEEPLITAGIDFALDSLGSIAGTVTEAVSGDPISGRRVEIQRPDGTYVGSAYTDENGEYLRGGLPAGTYLANTAAYPAYADELYDDIHCPGGRYYRCQPGDGDPITVELDATTEGVDFALDRLGSLGGRVVDGAGDPIPSVRVAAYPADGWTRYDTTDINGEYLIQRLPPEGHLVIARHSAFIDELYDDVPCPGGLYHGCEPEDGTAVAVELNGTTEGVDFALDLGGVIAGTVKDAVSGEPIWADIDIWRSDGLWIDDVDADSAGRFALAGLAAGTYFATARNWHSGYLRQLYDGILCPSPCDPTAGTPIAVTAGVTTAGIDFALERSGAIAGNVIDAASGEPLVGAGIRVWDATGRVVGYEYSDVSGNYTADRLFPGTHFVAAYDHDDYVAELYDDIHCPRSGCEPTAGTPVAVAIDATTEGIDIALELQGAIAVTVVDAATGEPLESIRVEIWTDEEGYWESCSTGAAGSCTVGSLYPATYYAVTGDSDGYLDELYDNLPCLGGPPEGCDPTKGTPIALAAAETREIDFALMGFDSGIAGRVSAEGVTPLDGVTVDVWDQAGNQVASTVSLTTGEYFLRLDPGTYTVSSDNDAGYDDQIYPGVPCPRGSAADGRCDPLLGVPITVEDAGPQMIVAGIDFELAPAGALIFGDGFESGDLSAWE